MMFSKSRSTRRRGSLCRVIAAFPAAASALAIVGCGSGQRSSSLVDARSGSDPQLELAAGVLSNVGERRDALAPGQQVVMGTAPCKPGHTCFSCFQCHGIKGEGSGTAAFPRIAGQDGRYLRSSLKRFVSGERADPTMHEVASALTDAQLGQVSAYFAALHTPALPVPVTDEQRSAAESLGRQIDQQGLPEQGVPPCATCHGLPVRKAGAAYPDIAGQYADYIVTELDHFREGRRQGADAVLMQTIARNLKPEQSRAVATYFSLLAPQPVTETRQVMTASSANTSPANTSSANTSSDK
jgi:cytochrome c553